MDDGGLGGGCGWYGFLGDATLDFEEAYIESFVGSGYLSQNVFCACGRMEWVFFEVGALGYLEEKFVIFSIDRLE